MKKFLLAVMGVLIIMTAQSQNKKHYTVSGGVLGGGNLAELSKDFGPSNIDYGTKLGYAFGAFLNFPLSDKVSLEPQLVFTGNKFTPDGSATGAFSGKYHSVTIPVLLKIHTGRNFAFTAGPQLNFLSNIEDENNNYHKDDFNKTGFGFSGGIEIFPHGRVTIFGRYIYGTSKVFKNDVIGSPTTGFSNYRYGATQFGLKLKLFGHRKKDEVVTPPVEKKPTSKEAVQEKKAASQEKDSDGDGIMDKDDKCPAVPGVAKYNGCPVPDTDGDGVNDEQDRCPKTPGVASNRGCPEITVYFKRDEFVLDPEDMQELDQVVRFLTNNPDLSVTLEGHASTLGGSDYNMRLSQHRVDKGKEYIVSKGVSASRIKTNANGEKYPIGDQKTEEGRAKSRRINVVINF
jgi:outer membrane protein OmpA-like peptidoglycan-associated protein